jgi:hypothetical protein
MGSVAVLGIVDMPIAAAGAEAASNTTIRHPIAIEHRLIRDWLGNS